MKIVTKKAWFDKKVNRIRKIGETQEVTEERYKEITETLKAFKNVTWVEPVEEEVEEVTGAEFPEYENITAKEIRALLDEQEIKYNSSDSKQDLYDLLTRE